MTKEQSRICRSSGAEDVEVDDISSYDTCALCLLPPKIPSFFTKCKTKACHSSLFYCQSCLKEAIDGNKLDGCLTCRKPFKITRAGQEGGLIRNASKEFRLRASQTGVLTRRLSGERRESDGGLKREYESMLKERMEESAKQHLDDLKLAMQMQQEEERAAGRKICDEEDQASLAVAKRLQDEYEQEQRRKVELEERDAHFAERLQKEEEEKQRKQGDSGKDAELAMQQQAGGQEEVQKQKGKLSRRRSGIIYINDDGDVPSNPGSAQGDEAPNETSLSIDSIDLLQQSRSDSVGAKCHGSDQASSCEGEGGMNKRAKLSLTESSP